MSQLHEETALIHRRARLRVQRDSIDCELEEIDTRLRALAEGDLLTSLIRERDPLPRRTNSHTR